MKAKSTYILTGLLMVGLVVGGRFCRADSGPLVDITVAEYRLELNQLFAATQQLDSSGRATPSILQALPKTWRVHGEQSGELSEFEISAEGLRQDVEKFEEEKNAETAGAIRFRIQALRSDLDGFEATPPDVTSSRNHLNSVLARREFRDVRGPSFIDRLAQRLVAIIISLLQLLFRSSAIPTISKIFVYALIGSAVLTLGFLAYRYLKSSSEQEKIAFPALPVSARNWALWLADARAAAAQSNWREAIHFAYWAGISFLELKGTWRPDRARTPREYLRLISDTSEYRETLVALTRIFELTWYAKRDADAAAFAQTMQALERLGCHSN